jgi:hypothetical protein
MKVKVKDNAAGLMDKERNVMFTVGEVIEVTEDRYNELKDYVEVEKKAEPKEEKKAAKKTTKK